MEIVIVSTVIVTDDFVVVVVVVEIIQNVVNPNQLRVFHTSKSHHTLGDEKKSFHKKLKRASIVGRKKRK